MTEQASPPASLNRSAIDAGYTYAGYWDLINRLLPEGRTTGSNHSPDMLEYTRLNVQRAKRWDQKLELLPELKTAVEAAATPWFWVILTEWWCGDSSQNLSLFPKLADLNPHIELRILLRDEHPEIMDAFLTNGARSIPKLICLRQKDLSLIGTWGPRPKPAQQRVMDYKANPDKPAADFMLELHQWYLVDQMKTLQQEFLEYIRTWSERG